MEGINKLKNKQEVNREVNVYVPKKVTAIFPYTHFLHLGTLFAELDFELWNSSILQTLLHTVHCFASTSLSL